MAKMVRLILATFMIVSFGAATVLADGGALYKSKGCAKCHGEDAKTTRDTNTPKLAGQNKKYVADQLKKYQKGKRTNKDMQEMSAGLSKGDMKALGAYVSGL